MLAVEIECFLSEGEIKHIHELFHDLFRLFQALTKTIKFIRLVTTANTQNQSPVTHGIRHTDFCK